MSARKAFYIHVFVLMVLITAGMSERTPWLNWAEPLICLVLPLMLMSNVMPAIVILLAKKEHQSNFRVAFSAMLSGEMTIASYFAILPLVQ